MTSRALPPTDRLAYDDPAPISEMRTDAVRCGARLERVARRATRPAPSIAYADFPREVAKTDLTISVAAQRLANALQLHLD